MYTTIQTFSSYFLEIYSLNIAQSSVIHPFNSINQLVHFVSLGNSNFIGIWANPIKKIDYQNMSIVNISVCGNLGVKYHELEK